MKKTIRNFADGVNKAESIALTIAVIMLMSFIMYLVQNIKAIKHKTFEV